MEQLLQEIEDTINQEQIKEAAKVSQQLTTGRPWQFVMIAFHQD